MSDFFVPKHLYFCTSEAKKKAGVYCCAYNCTKKPHEKKKGMCHMHYQRYRKIIDPVYDRYKNFKHNAIRRCKDFTITLEQFREFCEKERYILDKGKRGRNCTIDRIDNRHGYHISNIGIKSAIANTKKYHEIDKHQQEEDDCPF